MGYCCRDCNVLILDIKVVSLTDHVVAAQRSITRVLGSNPESSRYKAPYIFDFAMLQFGVNPGPPLPPHQPTHPPLHNSNPSSPLLTLPTHPLTRQPPQPPPLNPHPNPLLQPHRPNPHPLIKPQTRLIPPQHIPLQPLPPNRPRLHRQPLQQLRAIPPSAVLGGYIEVFEEDAGGGAPGGVGGVVECHSCTWGLWWVRGLLGWGWGIDEEGFCVALAGV